ncbi:peptidase A2 [Leptospira langatensis]|uniref:Peptidase A2 n=1 Tax=Leptospira langatensis TaxID=2484983 RepID=A0A5F1ZWX3_9LEPT|nr:peptidase A2 [Leptospira langatensis]TGJ98260.1 peptidase A2 [Leptospira langatensis]TGL43174.1 peptidase A2 [Leptospira langatensis]
MKRLLLLVLFSHLCLSNLEAKGEPEFGVLVHFRKYSHHNPFQKGVPFQRKIPAIRVDERTAVALLKPGEVPLFAEIHPDDSAGRKAYFQKVDLDTGLGILILPEDIGRTKRIFPLAVLEEKPRTSPGCSAYFPNLEWASLESSKSILPLSKLAKKENTDGSRSFLYAGKKVCGFTDGSWNGGAELLRRFSQSRFSSQSPFPHPGFFAEASLTPAEEDYYFPKGAIGAVVSEVLPGIGPMHNLFPGDAIISVNGTPVASKHKQVLYDLLLTKHGSYINSGDTVELTLYRDGRKREIRYALKPYNEDAFLIPESSDRVAPKYLISGGLLFTELTRTYLKEYGDKYKSSSDRKLVYLAESFSRKMHPEKNRIVLLSRTFPDEKNKAYQEFQDLILESVNDKTVDSVEGLKAAISENKENFLVFRFSGNKLAVFDKSELKALDEKIKSSYSLDSLDNIR